MLWKRDWIGGGVWLESAGSGIWSSFLSAAIRESAEDFQSRRRAASRAETREASTARMRGSTPLLPTSKSSSSGPRGSLREAGSKPPPFPRWGGLGGGGE